MKIIRTALALAAIAAFSGCGESDDSGSRRNEPLRPLGVSGPDLILTSLTVTAHTPNSISYSWTIRNIGDVPANLDGPTSAEEDNVSVQAYLSQDTIFENAGDSPAGGTILGLSPLGFLNPGESISGSFSSGTFVDPCSFAYLTLKADWGGSVSEVDEFNNTLATPINCCPEMEIDIKPGSDENPVNPKSKGVIPVAILGSSELDVHDIDQSTIEFATAAMDDHHGVGHFEDVNGDGFTDLVLHFRTQETDIQYGDTEACLSAVLEDGCVLNACDNIRTVPMGLSE